MSDRVDIFPRTLVSFNNSQSATVSDGVLLLDGQPFATISEVVAIAEGKEVDPRDNQFYLEPGRLFYQSLEFCNFVHRCTIVNTGPAMLIRECVCVCVCVNREGWWCVYVCLCDATTNKLLSLITKLGCLVVCRKSVCKYSARFAARLHHVHSFQ